MLIQAGGFELLLDDSLKLAEKAAQDGVSSSPENEARYGERRAAHRDDRQHGQGQDIIREKDGRRA